MHRACRAGKRYIRCECASESNLYGVAVAMSVAVAVAVAVAMSVAMSVACLSPCLGCDAAMLLCRRLRWRWACWRLEVRRAMGVRAVGSARWATGWL